jgi:glycosyltransferase involved in cell wall biosynthesis
MKLLFIFFNPSGGMETLNRIRSRALTEHGVETHLLYKFDGQGKHNIRNIKTFITNDHQAMMEIIHRENYDVIIVCSDMWLLTQIRNGGYRGLLIFELQGLGPHEENLLLTPSTTEEIHNTVNAIMYPKDERLRSLMKLNYGTIHQYSFDDPLDWDNFCYTSYPKKPYPIIGWVGRLQKNKNVRDFLMLGIELLPLYPELYLWLFDDNTMADPNELEQYNRILANHPTLRNRVIRYSNTPHELMADYLSIIGDSGGFLLSSSTHEGFGYAVAEAMICRCPVLSTDSGGVRRFIFHNKTGKFYDHNSKITMKKEAISLLADKNLRNRMITFAEQHIKKHFSKALYAQKFIQMLKELQKGR